MSPSYGRFPSCEAFLESYEREKRVEEHAAVQESVGLEARQRCRRRPRGRDGVEVSGFSGYASRTAPTAPSITTCR